MAEIILSFFAIIGVALLIDYLCDYLFFRKSEPDIKMTIDLRNKGEEELLDVFELLSTVSQRKSGQAITKNLDIIIDRNNPLMKNMVADYIRVFHLRANITESNELKIYTSNST